MNGDYLVNRHVIATPPPPMMRGRLAAQEFDWRMAAAARLGGGSYPEIDALHAAHDRAIILLREQRAAIKHRNRGRIRLVLVSAILGFTLGWSAKAKAVDLDLAVHGVSYHLNHRANGETFNEVNPGLGVRAQFTPEWSAQISRAKNSYSRWAWYGIGEYAPIEAIGMRVGAFFGLTQHYPANNGGVVPGGGLFVRWAFERANVTVRAVPPIDGKTTGVFTLELGVRI